MDMSKILEENKVLVVYHRVDFDGLASYCNIRSYFEHIRAKVEGFGYNYFDAVEMPDWSKYDKIVLVDISLPIDIMKELHDKYFDKVIWVDHHITAIQNSEANGYSDLNGIRDISAAACILSFKYFFPEDHVPYALCLLGANDIWDQKSYDWEEEVQPFQLGLNNLVGMNADLLWHHWYDVQHNADELIEQGKSIKSYIEAQQKSWVERFAFEVEVDGHLKGIAMLCPMFSSRVFKSVIDGYDVCVIAERNNKLPGTFNVSMYMENTDIDFSCGQYMKDRYEGGGHKGAAGGKLNIEQFNRLITECKI